MPLSFASLLTGIVESLGSTWGLFRHYWVATKLMLTALATIILLVHTQPIGWVAAAAAESALSSQDLRQLRLQLVGDASAALFVLVMTTALSVYKPWGMTPYGLRKQDQVTAPWRSTTRRRPAATGRFVVLGIVIFVLLIALLHVAGGDFHSH